MALLTLEGLRQIDILTGEATQSVSFPLPSQWKSLVKGKKCCCWSRFFPFRIYPFLGGSFAQGGKCEAIKVVFNEELVNKHGDSVPIHLFFNNDTC